jgi:hypothetical protein
LKIDASAQALRNPRALAVSVAGGKECAVAARGERVGAAAQAFHEAGHAVQAAAATKVEAPELGARGAARWPWRPGTCWETWGTSRSSSRVLGVPPTSRAHARACGCADAPGAPPGRADVFEIACAAAR